MRRNILIATIFSTLIALSGNVLSAVRAQEPPLAGAYRQVSTTDREVITAARFAVRRKQQRRRARISLVSIERAEAQVVAGTNYRLCLRVRQGNRTSEVTAIVYKNLTRRYSLSSWAETSCALPSTASSNVRGN